MYFRKVAMFIVSEIRTGRIPKNNGGLGGMGRSISERVLLICKKPWWSICCPSGLMPSFKVFTELAKIIPKRGMGY